MKHLNSKYYAKLADFILFNFAFRENWIREYKLDEWTVNDRLSFYEILAIKDIIIEKFEKNQIIKLKSELYECAQLRNWINYPSILIDIQLRKELQIKLKLSENFGVFTMFDLSDIQIQLNKIKEILTNIETFIKIHSDSFQINEFEF